MAPEVRKRLEELAPCFEGNQNDCVMGTANRLSADRAKKIVAQELARGLDSKPWEGDFELVAFPPEEEPEKFCRQFNDAYPCGTLAWRQRR